MNPSVFAMASVSQISRASVICSRLKEDRDRRRRIHPRISRTSTETIRSRRILSARLFAICATNGTYMVFRKIEQDVDRFRQDRRGAQHAAGGEDVATRFVGRRRDGTSLAVR